MSSEQWAVNIFVVICMIGVSNDGLWSKLEQLELFLYGVSLCIINCIAIYCLSPIASWMAIPFSIIFYLNWRAIPIQMWYDGYIECQRYIFLRLFLLHCFRLKEVCFSDFSFYDKYLKTAEKSHREDFSILMFKMFFNRHFKKS